jgi:hypothetical protein
MHDGLETESCKPSCFRLICLTNLANMFADPTPKIVTIKSEALHSDLVPMGAIKIETEVRQPILSSLAQVR